MLRSTKGQSIVEYIVVWSALIAAILLIAFNALQPAVTKVFSDSSDVVQAASANFSAVAADTSNATGY